MRLLKAPAMFDRHLSSRSTFYLQIRDGLMTPPVEAGKNTSAWPEHESEAILRARVAGFTDEQIRALVKQLVSDRAKLADPVAA